MGNVLTIKDPDLNTTSYTYDGLNRLLTDTNQLGAARTYGYDENSNQTSVTDRNNQTRTFTYDRLNRQTQENWLNGAGNSLRAITSTYNVGSQLTGLSDPDASYQYTYDLNGRLKTIANAGTPGVVPVVLTYAYDSKGNLTSVVDTINGQAGGTTSYTFDPLDQVSQINQSGTGVQNKQVNFTYNALGQMATLNRYAGSNGTQLVAGTTYTYDGLNRLQQLSHKKVDGGTIASYTYGYDAASRITSLGSQFANAASNDNSTYTYDNTNQLAGADHSAIGDEGYTYDANGNRTNTGYQMGTGNNNQLSSDGTYNYTYDNEGNLKTRTEIATGKTREFTWDYRNCLTGVTDKTGGTVTQQVSYTYDAFNQRIARTVATPTVGTQTTRFVYDRGNVYLEFSGNSSTPSTRYLYGPMVDQVLAQEPQGNTTWMLSDHLGSVRDLVNNSGTVVNHFTYDSFGQVVGSTGTVDTRYKFTGREYDSETGLYYYRARYFNAGVGKFIGQDPLGFGAGDSNLYRYVGNSPIGYIDPSGLEAEIYVHSGGHWYGHVAINVNGKVYTFGRYSRYAGVPHTGGAISEHGDLYIVPETAYLGNDKFTSSQDIVRRWKINLSTEEERSVVKFFESKYRNGIPEDFVPISGNTYEGRNISRYVAIGESCITETLYSLPQRITELIANTPSFYGDIAGPSFAGGVPFDPQDLAGRLSILSNQRNDVFQGLPTVKFKAPGPR